MIMLSVQELGTQILGGTPGKFYVLGGTEYGIKEKYISILKDHYGNKIEAPTVQELLNMMSKKHIIPLTPAVYVVRYDETFVSGLSDATAGKIKNTNIVGTIVCLYEAPKHITKLAKYLPDYTATIDAVSPQFVNKYLHQDFPRLADRFISVAVGAAANYSQAKNMCRCMNCVPAESLFALSDSEITRFFGCADLSTEAEIRKGVASRNFKYLLNVVEKYPDEGDRVVYAILQTMIELDKVLDNGHINSDVKEFAKHWTREDVYYMFMNTYEELIKLRSMSSYDVNNSLVYLFGLLKFQRIPSPEVMNS